MAGRAGPHARPGVAATRLALLSMALAAGIAVAVAKPVPEINSAVIMTSMSDWGPQSTRCTAMVDRAASIKQTRVAFVPTLFFVDNTGTNHDTGQARVSHWCYTRDNGGWCPPATREQTAAFKAGMAKCFKHAVARGLDLFVVPHVDDGTGSGLWRNGLVFDPLTPYSGLSYADFMLHPLADALREAMGPATRVWLANQGEMGATVVYHPSSHAALLRSLKARIAQGKGAGAASRVATGILTNADKLCACIRQDSSWVDGKPPPSYSAQFAAAWPSLQHGFDTAAIRSLFATADFVGFSNYPSLPGPAVKPSDFESGIASFALELRQFGVDLRSLIARRGTALFFSEVGVGGGADAWGGSRTSDPRAAAAATFYGVTQPYRPDADPWHADGPSSPMAAFLKSFYSALTQYASSRGSCAGCRWAIDGAFLWNCGSWDVEGVHPSSWAGDDPAKAAERAGPGRPSSYKDPAVVSMIVAHNRAAVTGRAPARRRPEGEEGEGPAALPAPTAPVSSRAAVFAEAARLAAAMMADGGGAETAEVVVDGEGGNATVASDLPSFAEPAALVGAGVVLADAQHRAAAANGTAPAATPVPAPLDLAAGAADGRFDSFLALQDTMLAAVDALSLPGGGSGWRTAAAVVEDSSSSTADDGAH